MVCTVVWLALSRLYNLAGGPGPLYIDHLVLSVDNATGENKNNIMMSLFAMLVFWGVIGKVEVNFMQVGHTHNKIDQIFSRYVNGDEEVRENLLCSILQCNPTSRRTLMDP